MFLYNGNRLENILNKVDEGLGTKEDSVLRTPNILRTIIARNSPDVYLLLMDMALICQPVKLKHRHLCFIGLGMTKNFVFKRFSINSRMVL